MRNSVEGNFTLEDIQKGIDDASGGLMVTGGEPTLRIYENSLYEMLTKLDYHVCNIETNGCGLFDLVKKINKLKDSKLKNIKYILSPKTIAPSLKSKYIQNDYVYKIVEEENIYVKLVIDEFCMVPENNTSNFIRKLIAAGKNPQKIYLMPKGTTPKELKENSKTVFDLAEKYKCNISSRLHLIYNFI
jgi:organic radical activating enzyme